MTPIGLKLSAFLLRIIPWGFFLGQIRFVTSQKYQMKSKSSLWLTRAYWAVIAQRKHFFWPYHHDRSDHNRHLLVASRNEWKSVNVFSNLLTLCLLIEWVTRAFLLVGNPPVIPHFKNSGDSLANRTTNYLRPLTAQDHLADYQYGFHIYSSAEVAKNDYSCKIASSFC